MQRIEHRWKEQQPFVLAFLGMATLIMRQSVSAQKDNDAITHALASKMCDGYQKFLSTKEIQGRIRKLEGEAEIPCDILYLWEHCSDNDESWKPFVLGSCDVPEMLPHGGSSNPGMPKEPMESIPQSLAENPNHDGTTPGPVQSSPHPTEEFQGSDIHEDAHARANTKNGPDQQDVITDAITDALAQSLCASLDSYGRDKAVQGKVRKLPGQNSDCRLLFPWEHCDEPENGIYTPFKSAACEAGEMWTVLGTDDLLEADDGIVNIPLDPLSEAIDEDPGRSGEEMGNSSPVTGINEPGPTSDLLTDELAAAICSSFDTYESSKEILGMLTRPEGTTSRCALLFAWHHEHGSFSPAKCETAGMSAEGK